MTDRFSEAVKEQQDKSAFTCESCEAKYAKKETKNSRDEKQGMAKDR